MPPWNPADELHVDPPAAEEGMEALISADDPPAEEECLAEPEDGYTTIPEHDDWNDMYLCNISVLHAVFTAKAFASWKVLVVVVHHIAVLTAMHVLLFGLMIVPCFTFHKAGDPCS